LKKGDPALLRFTSDQVLKRVDENGDLFQPVLNLKQKLPDIGALGEPEVPTAPKPSAIHARRSPKAPASKKVSRRKPKAV
jgi:hypothetical protein